MARIPLQVAQRGLDTGPLVSYPQGGGPIGAAVERAGDVIGAVAMKVQQKQDQQAAFDARVREMEFSAQLSGLEQDAETNAAIDGSGIHDGVYGQIDPTTNQAVKPGSFDQLFDSYLERMPESKRADFAAKREVYRLDGSNRLAGAEYKARQAYEKVQIDKAELDITNAMAAGDPNDIDTFERFKQQGIDLIENSGLPALEKDVAKTNWLANADETLFKTKLAKDPNFAAQARNALGLASEGPPVDVANVGSAHDGAKALLRKKEGFRSSPYWDVNAHRVGYGSDTITREDGSVVRVTPGMTVSRADAERDLSRRVNEFENVAIKQVGRREWGALPAPAKAALISTTYNYGSLPSNVVNAIKTGNIETIAGAVEGLQGHNGGVNAERRRDEAAMIRGQGGMQGIGPVSGPDPQFAGIPLDRRWVLANQADAALNDRRAEARGAIEVAVTNAPIAMQNTGEYSGPLPGYDAFAAAYGPEEGAQRYNSFQVAMDTGRQVFAMQTMPEAQVKALVADALPTASGETAALDQQRYTAISNAADATLKARAADPAEYVRNAFPSVRSAWSNAQPGEGYQQAVAISVAAQEQLGITDIKPLPKVAAENVVNRFKDVNLPENDRFSAVFSAMMSTQDAGQRRAIFEQLVDAGLPDITEGAVEALARGDTGAGRRLLQAAVIDPDKLPGQSPETPASIKEAIQSALMDDGQIGDIYYGLSDGTAENFVRAERDSKLLSNAVNLRLRSGEALEDAVNSAAKDLYGDVQIVDSAGRLNAQVLIPADQDAEAVSAGLSALEPKVRDAVTKALAVPADAPTQDGTKAILNAATSNYAENVLAEGYFRNSGSGFVFIDPYVGAAIADESGKPVIFTMQEILAAQPKRDARTPSGPLTDDAFDRFQQRFGQ